ncbi:MAG: hypothetical protein IPM97_06210 [Bdellovibrionaceae bacterium]|nr:hypothetical protein [Pseudobdellovibrionaceae bacterium]
MKFFLYISLALMVACQTIDRSSQVVRREVKDQSSLNKGDSGPRKRLIVLPFLDASENRPASLRDNARSTFIKELNRTGELVTVDSRDLKPESLILKEKGEYDLKEIAKQAQSLGANAVLEGKILDIRVSRKADAVGVIRQLKSEFEAVVRVRVIQARGGQEVFNTVKTVNLEEPTIRVAERVERDKAVTNNPALVEAIIRDAFLEFVPQVVTVMTKVSWEGRIAGLNGDRIYLNVGRISGIQVGDILKVLDEGDDVYDPESGGHIGKVPGRLKGTLEVVSYFGNDGAIAVIHSGSGFKENDRIDLY